MSRYPSYETLTVRLASDYVLHVELSRPDKMNAMNAAFWREIRECFRLVDSDPDVRVAVLSAQGKHFSSGLDLSDSTLLVGDADDVARSGYRTRRVIMEMQESFTVIEECSKPVIAAVHGGAIGGGVDLLCACDIRYCAADSFFCIKEVDIGLAADVGTLQRMPKIVGNEGLVRELALTARKFTAQEALQFGFATRIFPDRESVISGALELAKTIASKSPVATVGTKRFLNHARDHTAREGLEYAATWHIGMLKTDDIAISVTSGRKNAAEGHPDPNRFSKL